MKPTINILLSIALTVAISACEHKVAMETNVHTDGSLDKTIVIETEDTTKNFLGIGPQNGWTISIWRLQDSVKDKNEKDKKWEITLQKKFASAEEANAELATASDTLFRVSSKFDKKFRWFYSYLYYSDTYHAINRMTFPPDDYVTKEDYSFIERLPAEGTAISKADSLHLSELNKKIFDVYGLRAIFEAQFALDVKLIEESNLENRWLDTLKKHKENIYDYLAKKQDVKDDFMFTVMDSLGIPLPPNSKSRFEKLYKIEEAKLDFIMDANEGKYTHVINMPWEVVRTNADSVVGNKFIWNPPSIKFLLKDHTMYVETRRLNYWTLLVSAGVILFTGYLFFRRRT